MHRQPLLICLTFFAMAIGISTAQALVFLPQASETEPNDTFMDRNVLAAGGVTEFTVNGIDVGEMLDPNNGLAFLTVVTTVGSGTVDITQTAITVPEPTTLLLMAWGLGIAAASRRRC